MSGRLALFAEIIWRGNNSFAEMIEPNAIDHDAGRQRIALIDQPVREMEAAAGLFFFWDFAAGEDGNKTAADRVAWFFRVALELNTHVFDLRGLRNCVGLLKGQGGVAMFFGGLLGLLQ